MNGGMCAVKSDKNHLAPNWVHCDLIASLFLLSLRTAGSCLLVWTIYEDLKDPSVISRTRDSKSLLIKMYL